MKKLGKLKLHGVKAMSNSEMKQIQGGYGDSYNPCPDGEFLFACVVAYPDHTTTNGSVCATTPENATKIVQTTATRMVNYGAGVGDYTFVAVRCSYSR